MRRRQRDPGVPGRARGRIVRAGRTVGAALAALVAALGIQSCSENEEALIWETGMRPGLGAELDSFSADTLVVADAPYTPTVLTGSGLYLLVGHTVNEDPFAGELHSRAYLRWDVSGLPEGEITAARIDLILRDLQEADPADPESLVLEAAPVISAWTEDSLGVVPFPGVGDPFPGHRGVVPTAGVTDTSDVLVTGVFAGEGLRELVAAWRDDEVVNNGLAISPATGETQEGFLRLISAEGAPRGSIVNLSTPLLQVTIAADGGDTTISLEPVADGFTVSAFGPGTSAPVVTPDSLLILSAGYVQGLLFAFDLPALMASDPARFPEGLVIHQATLHLTAVRGTDWSLAPGDSLTILAYQTSTAWSEGQVPTSISLDEALAAAEFHEGEPVVLDVHAAVQQMMEGVEADLALTSSGAASSFRSLLFKSRHAVTGRPKLRIVYSAPIAGRLGAGEGGQ